MKKILIVTLFIFLNTNFANTSENNCDEFKKYSSDYFICKIEILKQKTFLTGKNMISETKEYQKKQWSEGKKQIENTKKNIEKTKDKVLEQ